MLLASGANPNSGNAQGDMPLHHIWGWKAGTVKEHEAIVRALLAAGANPNAQAKDGDTPLHRLRGGEDLGIARMLLKTGADPNALNKKRQTALEAIQEMFVTRDESESPKRREGEEDDVILKQAEDTWRSQLAMMRNAGINALLPPMLFTKGSLVGFSFSLLYREFSSQRCSTMKLAIIMNEFFGIALRKKHEKGLPKDTPL
jgi:hypothetical protein